MLEGVKAKDYAGGVSKIELVHNAPECEEYQLITSPRTHTDRRGGSDTTRCCRICSCKFVCIMYMSICIVTKKYVDDMN